MGLTAEDAEEFLNDEWLGCAFLTAKDAKFAKEFLDDWVVLFWSIADPDVSGLNTLNDAKGSGEDSRILRFEN